MYPVLYKPCRRRSLKQGNLAMPYQPCPYRGRKVTLLQSPIGLNGGGNLTEPPC